MASKEADQFRLLVYDNGRPPQCLSLSKRWPKVFFLYLPLLTLLSWVALIMAGLWVKKERTKIERIGPEKMESLEISHDHLKEELGSVQLNNKLLREKVASSGQGERGLLDLFHRPMGFKDRSEEELIEIADVSHLRAEGEKVTFKFNLINTNKIDILSGFIFVVMYGESSLNFFPPAKFSPSQPLLYFNTGESFSASRFRPVVSEFSTSDNVQQYFFRILVFSKNGDIIHQGFHGPFM